MPFLLLLIACADLPNIEANVCGNAVREEGEDCDTFGADERVCRAPGTPEACHFDCTPDMTGRRRACPAGLGCSLGGACRATTGEFVVAGEYAVGAIGSLVVGDYDGDGRADVLTHQPTDATLRSALRLHYFSERGHLAETHDFPRRAASPLLADLDGDQRSDLLFSDFRLGLLRGRADRAWVPDTFTTYHLPNTSFGVVGVHHGLVHAVSGFVTLTSVDGASGIYVADVESRSIKPIAELAGRIEDLAGRAAAGNLVEGAESPCLEVVLGFQGASRFSMLELCRPRTTMDHEFPEHPAGMPFWLEQAREQVVELPDDLALDNVAPLIADIDSDGHADVLVSANARPYLVRGDGSRLIARAEPYVLPFPGNRVVPAEIPMPLAAADFTADGHIDFVLPSGLLSSETVSGSGALSYAFSQLNRGEPWTVAQIADLNGNDLLDIVVASNAGTGIAFFSGTRERFQIPARLETNGPIRDLALGDFDGDQIIDAAFIQPASSAELRDSLAIAFGNPAAPPSAPLQVGQLRHSQALASYREAALGRLLATSLEDGNGGLTLLDGVGDRLLFAPCTLVNFANDRSVESYATVAFAVGAFTRSGARDVMALASPNLFGDWGFWLVPGIDSDATPLRLEGELPESVTPFVGDDGDVALSATAITADIDADGIDESIWMLPMEAGAHCALVAFGADASKRRVVRRAMARFEEPCLNAVMIAGDLDVDGFADLVVLTDRRAESQKLAVLWNDGQGTFEPGKASVIDRPDGELIRDVKLADDASLRFVTRRGLYEARRRSGERLFERPARLRQLQEASALALGDVNGDGVVDAVVADAAGLTVLLAELEH